MPKVLIVNTKQEIDVPQGANLRTAARQAGVEVHGTIESYLNCRGNGLCGTCRVLVKKGMENVNPKTVMEKINFASHPVSMLAVIGNEDEMRLACQVTVNGDISIETHPGINWNGENFWQKPYPNK